MGGCASSFARRACDSYMSGHGLVPIGVRSLAGVFCELPPTSAFATVAMGVGSLAPGALWNPDRGLNDLNDLRTIRFGQTLAGGAFDGSSALDTRCCRRDPFTVSQRVAAVSADHASQVLGGVARGYDPLFCGRLPDACGQLSPP